MSVLRARFFPGAGAPMLSFGVLAELLTAGLALWLRSEGVYLSAASGRARYATLAIWVAPICGAVSLVATILCARGIAIVSAWLTVLAMMTFSLFVWFAFYGLPCLAVWTAYAGGLSLFGFGDSKRA
jgi:hypothetical protein